MKRSILFPLVVSFLAASASALPTPEELRAAAGAALQDLAGFKPRVAVAFYAQQVDQPQAQPPAKQGQSVTLRLSGHVWLRGNAYVPQGSSFASVPVSGSTTLYDQNGRMLNGMVYVNDTVSVFLGAGDFVSAWARPYAYVSIYDNGKYLGSARIDGSINVSGWRRSGWLDLSGSGYVAGTLTYTE